MKSKLSRFCLIPLIVLLTFFLLSNFQITGAVEIITHWVPHEEYEVRNMAAHKASKGEILSKEEYDSLGNGNSFHAYNPHDRSARFYDKPWTLPQVVVDYSDNLLQNQLNEIVNNLRNAQLDIKSLRERIIELEKILPEFKQ